MIRRILISASILALAACGTDVSTTTGGETTGEATTDTGEELPAAATWEEAMVDGPYQVGTIDLLLEDTTRGLPAYGTFEGSDTRPIKAKVWYPKDGDARAPGKWPLVVYSHGYMSQKEENGAMLSWLAGHGVISISADAPLATQAAPDGPTLIDVPNQAQDVSFLIDEVLRLAGDAASPLHEGVDETRIGAAGLSMGGLVTFLAGFHPEWGDERLTVVASMAGAICILPESFYTADKPTLFLYGDGDVIAPYAGNGSGPYAKAKAPKTLITLKGGTHIGFAGSAATLFATIPNPDSIGCTALLGNIGEQSLEGLLTELGFDEQETDAAQCPSPCETTTPDDQVMPPLRQVELVNAALGIYLRAQLFGDEALKGFIATELGKQDDVTVESAP